MTATWRTTFRSRFWQGDTPKVFGRIEVDLSRKMCQVLDVSSDVGATFLKEKFCHCWAWSEETDWQIVELIRNNLLCVVWGCCFNSLIHVCPTVRDFHTVSLSANFVNIFFLAGDTQHQPSRLDHRFICSAKKYINLAREIKVTFAARCSRPLWRHSRLMGFLNYYYFLNHFHTKTPVCSGLYSWRLTQRNPVVL